MIKNRDKFSHALHNEAVCNYLELKFEFANWIITTAFYASLQFVSYKIFPFEVPSIDEKKTKLKALKTFIAIKLAEN